MSHTHTAYCVYWLRAVTVNCIVSMYKHSHAINWRRKKRSQSVCRSREALACHWHLHDFEKFSFKKKKIKRMCLRNLNTTTFLFLSQLDAILVKTNINWNNLNMADPLNIITTMTWSFFFTISFFIFNVKDRFVDFILVKCAADDKHIPYTSA